MAESRSVILVQLEWQHANYSGDIWECTQWNPLQWWKNRWVLPLSWGPQRARRTLQDVGVACLWRWLQDHGDLTKLNQSYLSNWLILLWINYNSTKFLRKLCPSYWLLACGQWCSSWGRVIKACCSFHTPWGQWDLPSLQSLPRNCVPLGLSCICVQKFPVTWLFWGSLCCSEYSPGQKKKKKMPFTEQKGDTHALICYQILSHTHWASN